MCIYLTLGVDRHSADHVLDHAPEGFRVGPTRNEDLRRQLSPLLALECRSPDMCDCSMFRHLTDTASRAEADAASDAELAADRRRRGWSQAKIEKALANRNSARTHRPVPRAAEWAEAFRTWMPLLVSDVGEVVLVAHMFAGGPWPEPVTLSGNLTIRAADIASGPVEIPEDAQVRVVRR
jgi:hypothetical protein